MVSKIHVGGNGFTTHWCKNLEFELNKNAKYQKEKATREIQLEVDIKRLAKSQMKVVTKQQKHCVVEHQKTEDNHKYWTEYANGKKVEYQTRLTQ